jgi:glycosyltransferase involved in cell wall biosynthesis
VASISAYIIARNHEWSIRRAIRSVSHIAEEIVVIDYESRDNTSMLAQSLGAKVISSGSVSIAEQKKIGERSCSSNWLLFLNANEEVSTHLQHEIAYIFQGDFQDLYRAYSLKIVTMGRCDFYVRKFAYCRRSIRLYNKVFSESIYVDEALDSEDIVLCNLDAESQVHQLDNHLIHRAGISLDYLVDNANFSSSVSAYSTRWRSTSYPSIVKIIFNPWATWFKVFFIRRYFIFGFSGFVDSCIVALWDFLRLVKIRENLIKRLKR